MAVIDSNNFITHLVWSGLVDKATCGELKEAIELCAVRDIYTKTDMVAMLDKIRAEIDGIEINGQVDEHTMFIRTGGQVKQMTLDIIDKYKVEKEGT